MNYTDQNKIRIASRLIRFGLAFVYGYASIEMFVDPNTFLRYVPPFIQQILPLDIFLIIYSILEILFTIWLLSGKRMEYAGILSSFLMLAIIIPNLSYFSILFRNVAIGFASLALTILDYKRNTDDALPN